MVGLHDAITTKTINTRWLQVHLQFYDKMATQTLNIEKMYQDLLKKYSESRNRNLRLLEEKREILLRSQENHNNGGDLPSRPNSLSLTAAGGGEAKYEGLSSKVRCC